jgi:hypothetical protein
VVACSHCADASIAVCFTQIFFDSLTKNILEVVSKSFPPKSGGIFDNRAQNLPLKPSGTRSRVADLNGRNSLLFRGCNLPPNTKSRSLGSREGFEPFLRTILRKAICVVVCAKQPLRSGLRSIWHFTATDRS